MSSKVYKTSERFAVLGENRSDAETVEELIRNVLANPSVTVKAKGYEGCSELMRKGARQLCLFAGLGYTRFIVCRDADRNSPDAIFREVLDRIVNPANMKPSSCIVVPVQEIEAWILADLRAVTHVIGSWKPEPHPSPETVNDPKEYLQSISKNAGHRPLYSPPTHNKLVAPHLDADLIYRRCPSFRPLVDFVRSCSRPAA